MNLQRKAIADAIALSLGLACYVAPPIEQLFGPQFRAAPFINVASDANQFAGITTLASGSATVVISTAMVNSDSLILQSQLGNANVSSGQTGVTEVKTISSGGYFTIGQQDGQALARDTLIHWMVLRTS